MNKLKAEIFNLTLDSSNEFIGRLSRRFLGEFGTLKNRAYRRWIREVYRKDLPPEEKVRNMLLQFPFKPLVSIIIPSYNAFPYLKKAINSVIDQSYTNWEVIVVDDRSPDKRIHSYLRSIRNEKVKVYFNSRNLHISLTSNIGIQKAAGEYLCFLDNDDLIDKDALFWIVNEINKNPDLLFLYTDEDKIGKWGIHGEPTFKPEWSPYTLLSFAYTNHFAVYKKSLLKKVGGYRQGYEGSQDYDLIIRSMDYLNKKNVKRIDKILYHWRCTPGSTSSGFNSKPYARSSSRRLISDYLEKEDVKYKSITELRDGVFYVNLNPLNIRKYIINLEVDNTKLLTRNLKDEYKVIDVADSHKIPNGAPVLFLGYGIKITENVLKLFNWLQFSNIDFVCPVLNTATNTKYVFMNHDIAIYHLNKVSNSCFVTRAGMVDFSNISLEDIYTKDHKNRYSICDPNIRVKATIDNGNEQIDGLEDLSIDFNKNLGSFLNFLNKFNCNTMT